MDKVIAPGVRNEIHGRMMLERNKKTTNDAVRNEQGCMEGHGFVVIPLQRKI